MVPSFEIIGKVRYGMVWGPSVLIAATAIILQTEVELVVSQCRGSTPNKLKALGVAATPISSPAQYDIQNATSLRSSQACT